MKRSTVKVLHRATRTTSSRKRNMLRPLSTAAGVAALLMGLTAMPASAASSNYGSHDFTSGATSWKFEDANGVGSIDVNYGTSKVFTSYRLTSGLQASCIPGSLNERLTLTKDKQPNKGQIFADYHPGAGCYYTAHPSGTLKGFGGYTLSINYNWRLQVGGQTGTATLNGQANFYQRGV